MSLINQIIININWDSHADPHSSQLLEAYPQKLSLLLLISPQILNHLSIYQDVATRAQSIAGADSTASQRVTHLTQTQP